MSRRAITGLLIHVGLVWFMLVPASALAEVLVGLDVQTEQAAGKAKAYAESHAPVTAAFTRHSVLLGASVPDLLLIAQPSEPDVASAPADAVLYIPGMPHPIKDIEQHSVLDPAYAEYTLVTLRLSPGVTFEQCEAQMAKVLKLARRYGAQPLDTWRVTGMAKGLPDADLFGLVGWKSGASALRFALKLRSEGQGFARAHDLNDENALVVQVKPLLAE